MAAKSASPEGPMETDVLPAAPRPTAPPLEHQWSEEQVEREAQRLEDAIGQPERWGKEMCRYIAPMTLEINRLKKRRNAVILAHSYQTPDIVYGVADHVGDSYGLSVEAQKTDADVIVFSSVRFMAETAKLLNPDKTVLIPEPTAGCSLADGITAADVQALRARHPGAPVLCYINTTAAVKAQCDATCTSSNYLDVARNLPGDELIFVPDRFMGHHLREALAGTKTVHVYEDAECEVHVQFKEGSIEAWKEEARRDGRDLRVLVHPECDPRVLLQADFVGSTEKMMAEAKRLVETEGVTDILPVTECGTADRLRRELPMAHITGSCVLCPHMKKSDLGSILRCLQAADGSAHEVTIAADEAAAARACIDAMFQYGG